jgi:regulator of sigma D
MDGSRKLLGVWKRLVNGRIVISPKTTPRGFRRSTHLDTPALQAQGAGGSTTAQQQLDHANARNAQLEREFLRGQTAKAKMEAPPKYGGAKEELAGWLVQRRAYFLYYSELFVNEAQKVGYAASRLEDKALGWFEPTLGDYLKHTDDEEKQEDFTQEVFSSYARFEEEIHKMFGNRDENLHAQQRLTRLRQTKSAAAYATKFRQDSLRSEINDEGLMQPFYDGLKDEVKLIALRVDPGFSFFSSLDYSPVSWEEQSISPFRRPCEV